MPKSTQINRKIAKKIFIGFLALQLVIAPFLGIVKTANAQADAAQNTANSVSNIISNIKEFIGTKIQIKEGFASEVLDVVAVTVAQKATQLLSTKITNWLSSGAEGPLFVKEDFKSLFSDISDTVIRKSLLLLNENVGDGYDPSQNNETALPLSVLERPELKWMLDYVTEFKTFVSKNPIFGQIGYTELTSYYDSNGQLKEGVALNNQSYSTGGAHDRNKEIWSYTIPLNDCTYVKIRTTYDNKPYYGTSGSQGDNTVSSNSNNDFGELNVSYDPNGKLIFTNPRQNNKVVDFSHYKSGSFDCGDRNPYALELTRKIVEQRNQGIEKIIASTFNELATTQQEFAQNATAGFNDKDPYAVWRSVVRPENNPTGLQIKLTNDLAAKIKVEFKNKELNLTTTGFQPDIKCTKEDTFTYPDGTEEKICSKNKSLTPSALIAGQAEKALSASFSALENTSRWQQVLATSLIQLTGALLEGGLNYIAKDIEETREERAAIKGLGPFDRLDPTSQAVVSGDGNSWQKVAGKTVDFSKLDELINLTLTEAEVHRQIVSEMRDMPALYAVADQQFALGPDRGWKERLRKTVQESWRELEEKTYTDNDRTKGQRRKNLLDFIQDDLKRHISFTEQALDTIPLKDQLVLQAEIDKSTEVLSELIESEKQSADKRAVAAVLITIRDQIINSANSAQDISFLLEAPPVWPNDLVIDRLQNLSKQRIAELSCGLIENPGTGSGEANNANCPYLSLSDQDLRNSHIFKTPTEIEAAFTRRQQIIGFGSSQSGSGLNLDTSATSDLNNDGKIDELDDAILAADLDQDGIPNDIEMLLCESFGVCTRLDPRTGNMINIDANTDSNGDGLSDYQAFLAGRHPLFDGYKDIDYNGDGDTTNTFDFNQNGTIDLREDINDYVSALEAYNARFEQFISSLNAPTVESKGVRLTLSRLVSTYLGIEKSLSNEQSVRRAMSDLNIAKERERNLRQLLDQVFLSFYKYDRGVDLPLEDIPRTTVQPAAGPGRNIPITAGTGEETRVSDGLGFVSNVPDIWCTGEAANDPTKCIGFVDEVVKDLKITRSDGGPVRLLRWRGGPVTDDGKNPACRKLIQKVGTDNIHTPTADLKCSGDATYTAYQFPIAGFIHRIPALAPNEYQWTGQPSFSRFFDKYKCDNPDRATGKCPDATWSTLQKPVSIAEYGTLFEFHQIYRADQMQQLYCNYHGILFSPLSHYNRKTGRENKYEWFDDEGNLGDIGSDNLWRNVSKCQDWYRSSASDYYPERTD